MLVCPQEVNVKRKQKRKAPAAAGRTATAGSAVPTVFDQMVVIHSALRNELELSPLELQAQSKAELPAWGRNIIQRLGRTLFKPVLKLRPKNGEVNWRHYGRAIGIVERAKAFWEHDVPRILATEFASVTHEQWEKIEARLGLDQLRTQCGKALGRRVATDEPLAKLLEEMACRQKAHLDQVRQTALMQVAQQPPKVAALFYKGMAEGYTLFLDELAGFSGDRGRTEVYLSLLGCMLEVEKLRRTQPPTTRARYYDELANVFKLRSGAYDWFNDICDDIKFPLNQLGRPRRSQSHS